MPHGRQYERSDALRSGLERKNRFHNILPCEHCSSWRVFEYHIGGIITIKSYFWRQSSFPLTLRDNTDTRLAAHARPDLGRGSPCRRENGHPVLHPVFEGESTVLGEGGVSSSWPKVDRLTSPSLPPPVNRITQAHENIAFHRISYVVVNNYITEQESPPARTQEAYRPHVARTCTTVPAGGYGLTHKVKI